MSYIVYSKEKKNQETEGKIVSSIAYKILVIQLPG